MSIFKSRFNVGLALSVFISLFTVSAAHAQYIVCKGEKFLSFEGNGLITDRGQTIRVGMFDALDEPSGMTGFLAIDLINHKGQKTILDIGVKEYRFSGQEDTEVYDYDPRKGRWRTYTWPVGIYEVVPEANATVARITVQVPFILEDNPYQNPTALMTVDFKSGKSSVQYTSWCRIR